jgi:hypothetical protein
MQNAPKKQTVDDASDTPPNPAEEESDDDNTFYGQTTKWLTLVTKIIVIIGLFIFVGYSLWHGLSDQSVLVTKLSDPAFARGLITFIITVSTIGLAFAMIYQAFSDDGNNADNKYRRAREIFASLMGVLGTIVGFYFGSAEKGSASLSVAEIQVIDKMVITNITGGTPPYRYQIIADENSKDEHGNVLKSSEYQISQNGWVKHIYPEKPKSGELTINVYDSKDISTSKKKELSDLTNIAK